MRVLVYYTDKDQEEDYIPVSMPFLPNVGDEIYLGPKPMGKVVKRRLVVGGFGPKSSTTPEVVDYIVTVE